jgi:hypothetical protein
VRPVRRGVAQGPHLQPVPGAGLRWRRAAAAGALGERCPNL